MYALVLMFWTAQGVSPSEHALLFPSVEKSGATLCLVELGGTILQEADKAVASRRRIIARFDATALLRADARASALSVIKHWDAPAVVREYLETGNEAIRSAAESAARSAVESAARSAAWSAARSAARSAAESAAGYAARNRFRAAVMAKFTEMGVIK